MFLPLKLFMIITLFLKILKRFWSPIYFLSVEVMILNEIPVLIKEQYIFVLPVKYYAAKNYNYSWYSKMK